MQEWPWAVRLVLLVVVAGGLLTAVAVKVFGRLFRDFRDSSLALVLERRFPELLGDRLITAVELADLQKAEAQGYSPAMIQETVHEAAERVEQVPVGKAFRWGRLVRRGFLALALTVGLYVLAGGLFLTLDTACAHPRRPHRLQPLQRDGRHLVRAEHPPAKHHLAAAGAAGIRRTSRARNSAIGRDSKIAAAARAGAGIRRRRHESSGRVAGADVGRPGDQRPELLADPAPLPQPFVLKPRDPAAGLTVDEVALRNRKFEVRNRCRPARVPRNGSWPTPRPAAEGRCCGPTSPPKSSTA